LVSEGEGVSAVIAGAVLGVAGASGWARAGPANMQPSAVEQISRNRGRDTASACCFILATRSAGASSATSFVPTIAAPANRLLLPIVFPPDFALIAIDVVIFRAVSTTFKLEHHVRHRLNLLSLFAHWRD
jgi:hypothetical protein